jgi:hypothetical protein
VVTDPFGAYDINRDSILIVGPSAYNLEVVAVEEDVQSCSKTYEYEWNTTGLTNGAYTMTSKAMEGQEEMVFDESTLSFTLDNSYTLSKSLTNNPTYNTTPHQLGDILEFQIKVKKLSSGAIDVLPVKDYFDPACFEFVAAQVAPNTVYPDSLIWANLGPVNSGDSMTLNVYLRLIGNCTPAINYASVEGALPGPLPSLFAEKEIEVDEAPVAVEDNFCLNGSTALSVLANDYDQDNACPSCSLPRP